MIGVFDSGHGGLTIFQKISAVFPNMPLIYLGDHQNAPYGNKSGKEVLEHTQKGVETLFNQGCKLVVLGCNTATASAARKLQQNWLKTSGYAEKGYNLLGVIAPTVEVATETPWSIETPQHPQKLKQDIIAVFGTVQTVASQVYPQEILKRCPQITVVQQACPHLAGAIEQGASQAELNDLVHDYVQEMLTRAEGKIPHWAILGCTHYPLVKDLFEKYLPKTTRLIDQPDVITASLKDYLNRHTQYVEMGEKTIRILTTGNAEEVQKMLPTLWSDVPKNIQVEQVTTG